MTSIEQNKHFTFIHAEDDLASIINKKANELFSLLHNFDASALEIDDSFKNYFKDKHLGQRLIFSLQSSAQIIYQSVKRSGKSIHEINIVDYGAGLGTLYMLAGMLGFKRILYNDYLPDWRDTAKTVCESLNIPITAYITGDIDQVLDFATSNSFQLDIIASRNVIEHIYSLPRFYTLIYQHNKHAVIFSTTTANYHNPAMWFIHYRVHKKIEKLSYFPQRKKILTTKLERINEKSLIDLTKKTRGKAKEDLDKAISDYQQQKPINAVPFLHTNTCDAETGYWCEHLLKKNEHNQFITQAGFKMEYSAGFWDTHYKSPMMNIFARVLNKLISFTGKKGYIFSPFVNVIAYN